MKKQNVYRPLTNEQLLQVKTKHPLVDLFLATGARIAEVHYLINHYEAKADTVFVPKKGTNGTKCPIYLSEHAQAILPQCVLIYKGVSEKTLYRSVVNFGNSVGIPMHPHMLRATFASQLAQSKVDIVRIQTLMNHNDISTTSQYIVFDERNLRAASEVMFNPKYNLDGKTIDELKSELLELRAINNRLVDRIKELEAK